MNKECKLATIKDILTRTTLAGLVLGASILPDLPFYQRPQTSDLSSLVNRIPGPLYVGFSFSTQQAEYLGLDPHATLESLLQMHFDYVRISTYLSKPVPQTLSDLDWQLSLAQKYQTSTIVSIGLKSQHYPEIYPPAGENLQSPGLDQAVLNDMNQILEKYGTDGRINIWQVENEPVDDFSKSGIPPISLDQLEKETSLVRSYSDRPVLMTKFLNPNSNRLDNWADVVNLGDLVGIDTYQGINGRFFANDKLEQQIKSYILVAQQAGKLTFFPEIQSEDWGASHFDASQMLSLFRAIASIAPPGSMVGFWEAENAEADRLRGDSSRTNGFKMALTIREAINSKS